MFRNIFWGKKSSIFVVCGRETWLTVEACNGQILIRSLTLTSSLSLSSLMVIWFWLGIITRDNKPSLTNRTELGEERLPTLRLYNTLYYLVFHYKYIVLSCISLHHVTSPTFRCGMTISSSGTRQTTAVSACYDCPQTRCGSLTSSSSTSK